MKSIQLLSGILLVSLQLTAWAAPASPWSYASTETSQPVLMAKNSSEDAHKRWKQLSPEEREDIRARREQYESLSPTERQKIRETHERYQKLSPEQRRELQEKWRQQRQGEQPRDRQSRDRD